MKTTIGKIISSDQALKNLLEQKLPNGLAIQLGKVVEELEIVFKKTEAARVEILQKYADEVLKDGKTTGTWNIRPETRKAFDAEMQTLFADEIELSIPQIGLERVPDACLAAKDLIALDWLWKDDAGDK